MQVLSRRLSHRVISRLACKVLNNTSLELVGPKILVSCAWWDHNMHQLYTCTVDKEHVKHKTEWVTSKQLNAKFQLVFQIFASSTQVSLDDINTRFRSILDTELFLEAWELSTHRLWGCNSDKHYSYSTARVQNAIFAQVSKDLNQQTNSKLLHSAQKFAGDSLSLLHL